MQICRSTWHASRKKALDVAPEIQCANPRSRLHDYLEAHDMAGLAAQLHRQSVDGSDFLSLSEEALTQELRLTPFAAKKLLKAREDFLNSP